MLGVSNALANRALQLLERRQIIARQQRTGAVIRRLPSEEVPCILRRVHFLVHHKFLQSEGVGNDHVLIGMQRELPGVQVQFSFLPVADEAAFVEGLINDSLKSQVIDGLILVRTSCETQQLVADSGLPAVVYGSTYPGVRGLPSIDRDMHGVGELVTHYLLERGHRRFAYLNRQNALPGDQRTLDAVQKVLGQTGMPADAVTVRFVPANEAVEKATARDLLTRDVPPTAFICRTVAIAEQVQQAAKELELPTSRADICVCDYYRRTDESPRFPYPRPLLSGEEQGHRIARLLAAKARQPAVAVDDEIIPVEMQRITEQETSPNGANTHG